jgi:hypothetical protein
LSPYVTTALRLGLANLARVATYRTLKRAGVYERWLPAEPPSPLGLRIEPTADEPAAWADPSVVLEADALLGGSAQYFSAHRHEVGSPPDWFLNPFMGARHPGRTMHWSSIADFAGHAGDIKCVWELSRFGWASTFARAWRVTRDSRYLGALAAWIEDWWRANPPNVGPNWKCGQETSIRLINALLALRIAGDADVAALAPFVLAHCRRIAATTSYAVAQDNNHGTSEAAALFIGGGWLARLDPRGPGAGWVSEGRRLLEERVSRLVMADGSFAQHSLTYHRVLLDTLSVVEAWRQAWRGEPFSDALHERARAATRWLALMIDPETGDGPNLGANDGAHPFRLDGSAYRDFRPSLRLAAAAFGGPQASSARAPDEASRWLGVDARAAAVTPASESGAVLAAGGHVVLRGGPRTRAFMRAPAGRFRPPHADALHLDLWHDGTNLLRDGGTYSYAATDGAAEQLAGVTGHSTIQFDDRDQMRRIGRFLYADWIRVSGAPVIARIDGAETWSGGYRDAWGCAHRRRVALDARSLRVEDRIDGYRRSATLRWRLAPGDWRLEGLVCASALARIEVSSDVPVLAARLVTGIESRHYLERTEIPVLEVEVGQAPATLVTVVALA